MKSDELLRPLLAFGAGIAVGAAVGRCWRHLAVDQGPDRHPYDVTAASSMAAERIHELMVDVERRLVSTVDDLMTQQSGLRRCFEPPCECEDDLACHTSPSDDDVLYDSSDSDVRSIEQGSIQRNEPEGDSSSEMDVCGAATVTVPVSVRLVPRSAPCTPCGAPGTPCPAIRRSRSPIAGLRSRDSRSDVVDHVSCPSTSQLFAQIDRLFDGSESDRETATKLLEANEQMLSNNANFMWRLAKSSYFRAKQEAANANSDMHKILVYKSCDYAKMAINLDSASPNAHKWYAITVGSLGEFEGISARIKYGYLFKKHIDMSIELNPNDATTHYLLGRWCYGVSKLTWVERKVATTLFSSPPTATVDDALHHFIEADRLHAGMFKENLLYLGKCYIDKGDHTTGVRCLQRASRVPIQATDDHDAQKEIEKLLRKHAPHSPS